MRATGTEYGGVRAERIVLGFSHTILRAVGRLFTVLFLTSFIQDEIVLYYLYG